MKRLHRYWLTIAIAAFAGLLQADGDITDPVPGDDGWVLRKSGDGIEVFTRTVAGWAIDEIRAVAVIDAPVAVLADVLTDPARRGEWDAMCTQVAVIKGPDGGVYHHLHYDMPWPVTDRDLVIKVESIHRPEGITITNRAVPGVVEVQPELVRIVQADATYRLVALSADQTRIETTALADPNGPIPAWLLNRLSVGQPFAMIEALRRVSGHQ